ncbi:hypothetical protein O181_029920 [Austropuccinia psidii MF-1]|uniref:Uncharacterized protein n=1 Tax=Austropuccinia psidii MF-1 TaxID=1389203 RepID=A0A9Q3CW58_9BASI|nr:hypothetical protein [Austropuccinia psidii MF-1]
MSSKLTELTQYSPSVRPPSVLHGSGILNQFSSPSKASSDHFGFTQIYGSYKEVEVLDAACTEFLEKKKKCFEHYNPRSSRCHYCFIGKKPCCHTGKQASNIRSYLWGKKDGPLGKEFPVSEAPIIDGTSGYSAYAEGGDELDGEEVEVIPHSDGHASNSSPSQPPAKRFQSQVIPSIPRNFQPTLATIPTSIPPASPHSSHTRPAFNPAVRPSPVQQSRNSSIVNSQELLPVPSTSRRREELFPLPFPAAPVFHHRNQWPLQVTRE